MRKVNSIKIGLFRTKTGDFDVSDPNENPTEKKYEARG